jgi:GH43 family beta-xylosidase
MPPLSSSSRRDFLQRATLGIGALAFLPYCTSRSNAPTDAETAAAGGGSNGASYTNPVYAGQFPDPFVLRHEGTYYAFATTGQSQKKDGRIFSVLSSKNLYDWEEVGGALTPPAGSEGADFWAPEVVFVNGKFYMYYSRGGGAINANVGHRLHVATSDQPAGPYQEVALLDVPESKFTIDAHPFQDTDGSWYLFYARDFIDSNDGYYPGTGLVVDKLIDMTKLGNQSRTVMRARHPWTLFEANRRMPIYNNQVFAQWHTLEGPFMRKHEGKYYCFYSGANFLTDRYGVDFVVADSIFGPYSDTGAEKGARVLHSVPGKVRGPGHHSHAMSPDGKTEVLVYHAWDEAMKERQLCIDPLLWTPEGPRCQGPTYTPQPRIT